MLYLFQAKLNKPPQMTRAEFYGLWLKEANKAITFLQSGECRAAYKISGADELVAILDLESNDRVDTLTQELPIWVLGAQHMVEVKWTPLREYRDWFEQLHVLAGEQLAT